jgi:trehalose-phosphatase
MGSEGDRGAGDAGQEAARRGRAEPFRAAILDLDGVLTRTAKLHAQAWRQMFDAFLQSRDSRAGEDHSPFDSDVDYLRYVDGKPRLDGVRSFLAARGITLPEGTPEDGVEADTVHGLGRRKNDIFLQLLQREPIQVFADAVEQVRRWRERGLSTALITSSRNGRRVLHSAGLADEFDVIIDGNDAARLGIRGKPAPDIFEYAARALNVDPRDAIVVEDAIAGVEAGRAGDFGLVVGVDRNGSGELHAAGADIVVSDLRTVDEVSLTPSGPAGPASALDIVDRITAALDRRRLALFFDYDGTLTPIVRRPEDATLGEAMRSLLRSLAQRVTVAVVSGRDLRDVRAMVGLDELYYAGSHGFDVAGPGGLAMQQESAQQHLRQLDSAEAQLEEALAPIAGAWVERKRFAIAVHYREAADRAAAHVERIVDEVRDRHAGLRKKGGKKIFELQPDVPWDKGRAVRWLLAQLGLDGPDVLPVYIGDDVTDEDAFRALAGRGIGIRVGPQDEPTRADYHLRDTAELEQFARLLLARLGGRAAP